jgi:hypothetical protein
VKKFLLFTLLASLCYCAPATAVVTYTPGSPSYNETVVEERQKDGTWREAGKAPTGQPIRYTIPDLLVGRITVRVFHRNSLNIAERGPVSDEAFVDIVSGKPNGVAVSVTITLSTNPPAPIASP